LGLGSAVAGSGNVSLVIFGVTIISVNFFIWLSIGS